MLMASSVSSFGSNVSRPKNHRCDFPGCDKAYAKPSLLEQHKRSHTGERPFKCNIPGCDKSFLRKSHLQAHEISHKTQDAKPFHCSICGKGVNTAQHLKNHEITHQKSFKCKYEGCDEAFYKHQTLRHHILSVHEKSLTCHKCNKTFARPYRLAQHNLKYHSETPTYQCDTKGCFKNFKTWSALQLHIKNDHPKIYCKICGKGCVGTHGLMSHMITHDDSKKIKLWNCNYCNSNFVKKFELINHYNEFHDANIPDDLLKPQEREMMEKLLNSKESTSFRLFNNNEENDQEEEDDDEDIKSNLTAQSLKSLDTLNAAIDKGNSIFDILSSTNKKISCPKNKCDRYFTRDYDLKRHLKWHEDNLKKVSAYLDSLEDNPNDKPNDNCNDNDNSNNNINEEIEINQLIEKELNSFKSVY